MFECICVLYHILSTSHTKYQPLLITIFTHSTGSPAITHLLSFTCRLQSLHVNIKPLLYAIRHLQLPNAYRTPFIAHHHFLPASCCPPHWSPCAITCHCGQLCVQCLLPASCFLLPFTCCTSQGWTKANGHKTNARHFWQDRRSMEVIET